MKRKRPFISPERIAIPRRVRAEIILRQEGLCPDCGTGLILGEIVFDHRPPIALREAGDNVNDPDRLAAICSSCDRRKTPDDLRNIAKAKRLAEAHQDHLTRRAGKVPGRKVPSHKQRNDLDRFSGYRQR